MLKEIIYNSKWYYNVDKLLDKLKWNFIQQNELINDSWKNN